MRNLPAPICDAEKIYDAITGEKRNLIPGRLRKIRKNVHTAYRTYIANSSNLETLAPIVIKPLHVKSLIHAYVTETKSMRTLRADLMDPDLDDFAQCPYCGINEPKTLDHYIPKESHPEFSIFPINLIPICNQCNSKYKGKKFLLAGKRIFLHSYLDALPDHEFIVAEVSVGRKIEVEFKLSPNANYKPFSDLLGTHFAKLNLNERFKDQSSIEMKKLRESLKRVYNIHENYNDVENELTEEANDFRMALGANHWKVALYRGLASSREYCDGGFTRPFK